MANNCQISRISSSTPPQTAFYPVMLIPISHALNYGSPPPRPFWHPVCSPQMSTPYHNVSVPLVPPVIVSNQLDNIFHWSVNDPTTHKPLENERKVLQWSPQPITQKPWTRYFLLKFMTPTTRKLEAKLVMRKPCTAWNCKIMTWLTDWDSI